MAEHALLEYRDLLRCPEDNVRREILAGELLVTPSPTPQHQRVVGEIFIALHAHAGRFGGVAFGAPVDVVLSDHDVVQPDVVYVGLDRVRIIGEKALLGVPSLLVEVLSPSTSRIDAGKKQALYARFRVPEYWIVDINGRTIAQRSDSDGERYATSKTCTERITSATLPNLDLLVADLIPPSPA